MPSDKILKQKQEQVKDLARKIRDSKVVILADYRGITVQDATQLREELRKANIEYRVVKNTLARFAAREDNIEGLDPYLEGPTAIALSYQELALPAKILLEFAKKNEKFRVKAGLVEGKITDLEGLKILSRLPPREVLISRVLGGFNTPIASFVNVLNGPIRGLALALNAIARQKAGA